MGGNDGTWEERKGLELGSRGRKSKNKAHMQVSNYTHYLIADFKKTTIFVITMFANESATMNTWWLKGGRKTAHARLTV